MLNTVLLGKTIYLDHAATTPTDEEVLRAIQPYFSKKYSNASSMHGSGRRAKEAINIARGKISNILNALPEEIIFTGSGTEADNLAMFGVARGNREAGNHIIISSIEHKAVIEPVKVLEKEGFEISILPVDRFGTINIEDCLKLIKPTTILVSVMYANNEIGTIEPVSLLGKEIRKLRGLKLFPLLHTDACQAAEFLSLDVEKLQVDLMTLNSSKVYGPKGVGLLYKKKGVKLNPVIVGGEQEMNLRAGTENVANIVGFAEALAKADKERGANSKRLSVLRDYFISKLLAKIEGAVLNGEPQKRLPNNVHISIPYVEGESILLLLDQYGIEASTGSACSAYDLRPSHVLMAIGQSQEIVHGSLRFSMGRQTKKEEIDYVLSVLPKIVDDLTRVSALTVKL